MLKSHFDALEEGLLALSKVPANAGHALHMGTPREAFVRSFLGKHLSERVAVGSGELISSSSKPRESRNQHDAVIFRRDYPRLEFGEDIHAFLIESVVATIEVKSTLTKEGLRQAVTSATRAKGLERHLVRAFSAGYEAPSVLSYLVAYDGPAKMETVRNWLHEVMAEEQVSSVDLPQEDVKRQASPSSCIDGVFVLGKGFLYFDNVPIGLAMEHRRSNRYQWIYADREKGSLFLLWLFLTGAISGISGSWLNAVEYVKDVEFGEVTWAHW